MHTYQIRQYLLTYSDDQSQLGKIEPQSLSPQYQFHSQGKNLLATVEMIINCFEQKLYIQAMIQDQPKIQSVEQLPVKARRKTDFFCTLFLATYVVLLALICIFIQNSDNLNRITYPSDNEGKLCGYDSEVVSFPYLYYTSAVDPTKRLCVNQCPKANDTLLSCKPTATLGCRPNTNHKYQVRIYNTYLDEGRIGLFCLPTDSVLKEQILRMSNTQSKYAIFSVVDAILTSAWTAALAGVIIFFLTHFWPYKTVPWIVFFGAFCNFALGVFQLTFTAGFIIVKIILCAFFIALGILSLKTLYDSQRRQSLVVCTQLISVAVLTHTQRDNYGQLQISFKNIKRLLKPLLLILCFSLVYILFFFLNMKQILYVWSAGKLVFLPDKPFYTVVGLGSTLLTGLISIQIIWGAFFIKQAYNFIASSHSVSWYFGTQQPSFLECAELLLRYHWGSVVGGSLLQGFFYFFQLFYNFIWDKQAPKNNNQTKAYKDSIEYDRYTDTQTSSPIKYFLDLVHGQALAYVSLVNLPYCNAARYCEFLSANSPFYSYSQTTNRILRVNMHIVPMFLVMCVGMEQMGPSATPYSILIVAILSYFIITYFLSYHGEKAEGLLICLYVDQALNDGYLQRPPFVLKEIYQDDLKCKHRNITVGELLCNKDKIIIEKHI